LGFGERLDVGRHANTDTQALRHDRLDQNAISADTWTADADRSPSRCLTMLPCLDDRRTEPSQDLSLETTNGDRPFHPFRKAGLSHSADGS
jgi:hypothetical protein